MTKVSRYSVVKLTSGQYVDLQLQGSYPNIRLKWVNVRNKSLYNCSACTMSVNYNATGAVTVTVPPGQYDVSTFVTELEGQLRASVDAGFTVEFVTNTQRMSISNSNNDFTMTALSACMARLTGFLESTSYTGGAVYIAGDPVCYNNGAIGVFGLGTPHLYSNVSGFNNASMVIPDVGDANSELLYDQLDYQLKIDNMRFSPYLVEFRSEFADRTVLDEVELVCCFESVGP